jgi:hypothetical protein
VNLAASPSWYGPSPAVTTSIKPPSCSRSSGGQRYQ